MTAARATLSLYDGRQRLGGLERRKRGGFAAYDVKGKALGNFPSLAGACKAILAKPNGVVKKRNVVKRKPRRVRDG